MAQYQILARKPLGPSGTGPEIQGVEKQRRKAASGPRPETRILRQPALEGLTNLARTETPRKDDRNKSDHDGGAARRCVEERRRS
ncbi:hypothetical protein F511_09629 [Dorcoceras hygrometricum]|uniref:Uncharacterized protein n=1 Tax=Dorcoceras hygrometricum TaxID=472368 RepID=A0A2Z7D781_9LAMI|nr:hypothetical protein F511_09629 [Dorcoceras hygrometricum]